MKTFQEFLEEAVSRQHQQIKMRLAHLIIQHKNDPEKMKPYKDMLKRYIEKQKPEYPEYPNRQAARQDKFLIPSTRSSSFPELSKIPTLTQNPNKIRKQKVLGEIK